MTTMVDRPTTVGPTPSAGGVRHNRLARWQAGWRIGMIMGSRDARHSWGRSILIMLMIGLPVMALVAGLSALYTEDISGEERLPGELGTTAAVVYDYDGDHPAITQDAYAQNTDQIGPGRVLPGHRSGNYTPAEIATITGSRVIPFYRSGGFVRLGGRSKMVDGSLAIAPDDYVRSGLGTVVSGRAAAGPGEIAVTPDAVRAGVPNAGQVEFRSYDEAYRTYRVVGVVQPNPGDPQPPWFVLPLASGGSLPTGYLIDRTAPVTWPDVQAWNAYGLQVLSRAVVQSPPPSRDLDPSVRQTFDQQQNFIVGTLLVIAVIAETILLAGPAFAVSARHRRRSLALAAANGADRRQLRQYVLAQALLLGAAAAVAGAILGLGFFAAVWAWSARPGGRWAHQPVEVPVGIIFGVMALAIVSAGIAALWPARGLGRLQVASALAGRDERSSRPRGTAMTLAIVLIVLGAALSVSIAWAKRGSFSVWSGYLVGLGALAVLIGAVLVVPDVLRALAPLLSRPSLALRLAARDGLRQQSRTIPAIAAVMVASAAVTGIAINDASSQRLDQLTYQPQAVFGRGVVQGGFGVDDNEGLAQIRRLHPDWSVLQRSSVGTRTGNDQGGAETVAGLLPPGCTVSQTFSTEPDSTTCANGQVPILVAERAVADPAVTLTAAQTAGLADGGALVTDPQMLHDGRVTVVTGVANPERPDQVTQTRSVQIPAVLAGADVLNRAFPNQGVTIWMLPRTAAALDLPTTVDMTELVAPGGISEADQEQINQLDPDGGFLYVERGYVRPAATVQAMIFALAGFLVLVAALVATALSQVESRADLATLSALGSTGALRRRLAAAQAGLIAVVGTLLGALVGLPLGVAAAISAVGPFSGPTTELPDVVVVLPWAGFAVLLIGIPLLAMAVAAVSVRRAPTLTRRLD